jgi:hypothetical protein
MNFYLLLWILNGLFIALMLCVAWRIAGDPMEKWSRVKWVVFAVCAICPPIYYLSFLCIAINWKRVSKSMTRERKPWWRS